MIIRRVRGQSMLPALKPGQIVIGTKSKQLKPGQLVIFRHHGIEKIKRVNQLRAEELTVLGDNSNNSTDSRDFGWLARKEVIAKVIWPRN